MEIKDISIEDKKYRAYKKAYKYTRDMLKKEAFQAAEGLVHNLNSLQSRSGKWRLPHYKETCN